MSQIPAHLQSTLLQERYAIEDAARALIRKVVEQLGPEVRDELRYVLAKGEVFFDSIDDLIYFDPSERSPEEAERRRLRRHTDELIYARAQLDRQVRDARRRAVEAEENVRIDRARRHADELKIEIARLDTAPGA